MSDIKYIALCAKGAKTEIKLSSRYLKSGVCDLDYVRSMLAEAEKMIDYIIDETNKEKED